MVFYISGLGLLVCVLILVYIFSRRNLQKRLLLHSQIAQTVAGPIEYVDAGEGPVVLHSHGMWGGCDHWQYCEFLIRDGYRVIVPSRPGYLRTPLSIGRTPREQAEEYNALLDALQIDRVAIYAISQGGASALEFAQMYPRRCAGLVLVSAFTRKTQADELKKVLPFIRFFLSFDFLMWFLQPVLLRMLMAQAAKALPSSDRQDPRKMQAIRAFFQHGFSGRPTRGRRTQ